MADNTLYYGDNLDVLRRYIEDEGFLGSGIPGVRAHFSFSWTDGLPTGVWLRDGRGTGLDVPAT